ncbi:MULTISPECIES: histidine phosphatase family protein [Sphingobium]|jgi:broad specificity phosphatase PhoE|uniref:histidine phosphatase family protein n=1 Tax=Sphingobium TaxID=165695 RepID=UPI000DBADE09|nr:MULTISPECIES: histidine phosphatase family protein [Sphingobium]KAA9012312.1 histidine phosphatase family protein [Sphingobium limneticum]MBU0931067.1 histidine phosphatase family protein [Alphaproteobacteria bacterium]BBD00854.1 probable phosphoglycerate mutase [Sphingobium sp. YG1]
MRRLFIIRHGNTFASSAEACRVGARTDIPLVESGRAQADRLGDWFAQQKLPIDRLFSSPLQRARETADRIAAATGHARDGSLDWLGEIDHGPDEGRPESEVLARIGAQALVDWDERGIAPDGWIVDADRRLAAWRAFFAEGGAGVDLLVTSNGAARFALIAAGLPLGALKLRTGAFGELAVAPDGMVTLVRWDERP